MIELLYILMFVSACCGAFLLGGLGTFSIVWYRDGKDAAVKFWKEEF